MSRAALEIVLEGEVCSGLGEGAHFIGLAWVMRELERQLGFLPHPGTFNLRLAGPAWEAARQRLAAAPGIAIRAPAGGCGASCFPVVIDPRLPCAAIVPQVSDYPSDKLEIVAPLALRAALGLRDGDRVGFRIALPHQIPDALPGE